MKSGAITPLEAADRPKPCQAMPNRGDQSLGQRQLQLKPHNCFARVILRGADKPRNRFSSENNPDQFGRPGIVMSFSLRMRRTASNSFHQLPLLDLEVTPAQ